MLAVLRERAEGARMRAKTGGAKAKNLAWQQQPGVWRLGAGQQRTHASSMT